MKRILGTTLAVLVASLVASSACVANNGSIFVRGVLAPPQTSQAGGCVYQANADGPFISGGVMDVSFTNAYQAELLVGNQMNQRGNSDEFRVETNRVQLQGSVVRVTDSSGAQLSTYTVVGGGFVDPGSGGSPSYSTFGTTLIDENTGAQLAQKGIGYNDLVRLIAYVKVFGTTLGGQHVESDEFVFPVSVCYGCLVSFPSGSDDPSLAQQPNCLGTPSSSSGTVTPCIYGQDQPIDCTTCQGNAVCDPANR